MPTGLLDVLLKLLDFQWTRANLLKTLVGVVFLVVGVAGFAALALMGMEKAGFGFLLVVGVVYVLVETLFLG